MSANTFNLHFGDQDTVNLERDGGIVLFKIAGSTVISVDLFLGRASLHNPTAIGTLQKKNCFNRFFTLVVATRYMAENTDDGLVIKDRKSGDTIAAHKTMVTITIPTMSVMQILCSLDYGFDLRSSAREWRNSYATERLAQQAITT